MTRLTYGELAQRAAANGHEALADILHHIDPDEMNYYHELLNLISVKPRKHVGWMATSQSGEVEFAQDCRDISMPVEHRIGLHRVYA